MGNIRNKCRLLQDRGGSPDRRVGGLAVHGPAVTKWDQAEGTFAFGKKEVSSPGLCLSLKELKLPPSPYNQKGTEVY